jgi:hypothetical protein
MGTPPRWTFRERRPAPTLISPHSLPINPYPLHTPDNDAWCDGYNDGEDALGAMLKGLVPGGPDDVTDMED